MKIRISFFVLVAMCALLCCSPKPAQELASIEAVPTFHNLGLYWKPKAGAQDNPCSVKFREQGTQQWLPASDLWFDATDHQQAPEHAMQYRGSIVNLKPDTSYEVRLTLASGEEATVNTKTRSEEFKVKRVISLPNETISGTYQIAEGGSEKEGYVVYQAQENTLLSANKQVNHNVEINASYVILRGVTMKGANLHGVALGAVNHVVIEGCDISDWGRAVTEGKLKGYGENFNSAIYSKSPALSHTVIQRNKLHHPTYSANSWELPTPGTHPEGPQGITFEDSEGYHIIRYNDIYSDEDHKFNDSMGEWRNFSFRGFPNRDSDIYANNISHCYDDAIEAEGSGMNVRIFGNHIDHSFISFGLATQSLGPMYLYRNVVNFSQRAPYPTKKYNYGGAFVKIGSEPKQLATSKGSLFIYHNTLLQPATPWKIGSATAGASEGILYTSPTKVQSYITTRNNIIHVREGNHSVREQGTMDPTNDFDYDLYSGNIVSGAGSEKNGLHGLPVYSATNKTGEYALDPQSAGYDQGVVIPNFNDHFSGKGPDMGAFEAGSEPMLFGIHADWNLQLQNRAL